MQVLGWMIFGISFLGLAHSYLLYPFFLWLKVRKRTSNSLVFSPADDDLPFVSIVSSLYNEEAVIAQKIHTLFQLQYPSSKLQVLLGSDCSADQTNSIVANLVGNRPHFHFFPFSERRGKPPVINDLVAKASAMVPDGQEHILIITDANVMLEPSTLFQLIKHFKHPKIMLVDAHMSHVGMQESGISKAEDQYISTEVRLKHWESLNGGRMVGPFGGCYAIRATHFSPVPENWLVDDFYIAMKAFEQGGWAINELAAICYEGVSHDIKEEYRRKRRISAGNFQNMRTFRHLWWPPLQALSYAFFSHKVLRWLGPFFIFGIILGAGILALLGNLIFTVLFPIMIVGILLVIALDQVFAYFSIHIKILRGLRYFLYMNAALLEGFFKYLKGIKTNVWQPPKRSNS